MAHQRSRIAAVVLAVVTVGTSHAAATESSVAVSDQASLVAHNRRVRGVGPRFVAAIGEAAAQSKTFRGLVDQIGTTDGIVFVEEGQCGHGVHACLLFRIALAGPNRLLWILVDPRKSDRDLMASIGHELQHAVEVLSNRTIKSGAAMYSLYFEKCHRCGSGGAFETYAATRAGTAVRDELRKNAAAGTRRE